VAKTKGRSKAPRKAAAKKPAKRPGENQPPTESDSSFLPVVKAFANDRQVVCDKGWGAGNTVLKVKRKIFAMTVGGDLVVKISKQRAAELVNDGAGAYFDPRHDGRLMKEWVVIEAGKANWIDLAHEAHRFVSGGKS
jgi:hypothetical protein